MNIHKVDVVIVGTGGAGLMASIQVAPYAKVAVLSKLYPTRSHTGAAQGGIGAALGNRGEDSSEWHMFDTVKGSDYLGDQSAIEVMCKEAIDVVYELEHMGLPFNRTEEGKIDQRPFGGHTREFGKEPVKRACFAADRTGHMIIQTLYQQCIKHNVEFFNEFQVVDLIVKDNVCCGVVAICIATGEIHIFHSKAVLFATGGFGRMYKVTSNAYTLSGDGVAICYRNEIPLEDMEFFQFHPTGIYKLGILLTEGARGEGGILINNNKERFMKKYAPTLLDLAPRDIVSRCIYTEVREGRGIDGKDYVYLDLTHLGKKLLETKLPDITDFVRTYLGIDPVKEPVPVQPTAHYAMGGIPTDVDGRVVIDDKNTCIDGLYAAGECACVSVHGGNRLGTNSLVDIVVFGRRAGKHMKDFIKNASFVSLPKDPHTKIMEFFDTLRKSSGKESLADIRETMQKEMMDNVSVFRTRKSLSKMIDTLNEIRERFHNIKIGDISFNFNIEIMEAFEFSCLLDLAYVTTNCALIREESRGAHYREDFPNRNDKDWLKHTLAYKKGESIDFKYKPVSITKFQPKERKY